MGSWALLAVAAVGCLFIGYRTVALETRLEALSAQVGSTPNAVRNAPNASAPPSGAAAPSPSAASQGARLEALEDKAAELRGRVELAKLQTAIATGSSRRVLSRAFYSENLEEKIKDVVRRKRERVVDEQLSLIQKQLVAGREGGLAFLAQVARLTEAERRSLDAIMKNEAQQMIDVFRDADMRENPEAAVERIRTLIDQTDQRVRTILDDEKMKTYLMGRAHEQRMLMPWLERDTE